MEPPALWITGTVGVGKTTTAGRIGALLAAADRAGAVIDMDALRFAWPSPVGDRFNEALSLTNLASVSVNLRAAGHRQLVLAGVVETAEQRRSCEAALGSELVMVRLTGPGDLVDERIRRRHRDDDSDETDDVRWHLHRRPELDQILTDSAVEDHVVSIAGRSPEQVAAEVLHVFDEATATLRR